VLGSLVHLDHPARNVSRSDVQAVKDLQQVVRMVFRVACLQYHQDEVMGAHTPTITPFKSVLSYLVIIPNEAVPTPHELPNIPDRFRTAIQRQSNVRLGLILSL